MPASAAAVCMTCQITGGAAMMGYWPFRLSLGTPKKIRKVSKSREPVISETLLQLEIALHNLKLGFYSLKVQS